MLTMEIKTNAVLTTAHCPPTSTALEIDENWWGVGADHKTPHRREQNSSSNQLLGSKGYDQQ
jgi:hypothetical protein